MVVSETKVNPKQKTIDTQASLENYILLYQDAYQSKEHVVAEEYYSHICEEYNPKSYIRKWYSKYGHIYDSLEDFEQEYMCAFLSAVRNWKPRHLRRKSTYDGKGYFMNYFWACLRYKFINEIKAAATCKMNVAKQCPLCLDWHSPLSTHLIKQHADILWDHLRESGLILNQLKTCPYCSTIKITKLAACKHQTPGCESCNHNHKIELIKKHLLSHHSNYLFERFHALYPEVVTLSSKPISVNLQEDEDSDSLYDIVPSTPLVSDLMEQGLTAIQQVIIVRILDHGLTEVKYDTKLYKCSESEFENELEDLKTKLVVCGLTD